MAEQMIDEKAVLDNQIFLHVKDKVTKCIDYRAKNKFDERIDDNEKRYKAMRSIRGLEYGDLPKSKPWPGCSDIGIPLEAITIQAIVARTDKVEWEKLPLTYVSGVEVKDKQNAPKVSAFLDWQKLNKMRLRIPKMMATRRACIDGSYFWKNVWEHDWAYDDEEIFALKDPDSGTLLKDEEGELAEWNPDEPTPLNDNLKSYQVVPGIIATKKKTFYRGPKAYGRNCKQILWSPDETNPDIESWDWVGDSYYRSVDWLSEHKFEDIGVKGFKNVDFLIDKKVAKLKAMRTTQVNRDDVMTEKAFIVEWYGKFKVKNKIRDIVVAYAPEEDIMLGWEYDEFKSKSGMRRFVHRQVIPMDGQVIGMSIITFLKGLREAIDMLWNQMIDRGSRNNNPPIVYVKGSGFNPEVHNFGYRFWPEKESGQLRVLPLPPENPIEFAKLEFLFGIAQRLFGVTDTTQGMENPANTTATGIVSLLTEGNINIDSIIAALNESNIVLDAQIIALNAVHMAEEGETFPIVDSFSAVMDDPDNPFTTITPEELRGNYNYMPRGSTLASNTSTRRAEAFYKFDIIEKYKDANIFLSDLNVEREVTNEFFKEFDLKNIKLISVEEAKAKMEQAAEMANQPRTKVTKEQSRKSQVGEERVIEEQETGSNK